MLVLTSSLLQLGASDAEARRFEEAAQALRPRRPKTPAWRPPVPKRAVAAEMAAAAEMEEDAGLLAEAIGGQVDGALGF